VFKLARVKEALLAFLVINRLSWSGVPAGLAKRRVKVLFIFIYSKGCR
jgi:hypothetical protein